MRLHASISLRVSHCACKLAPAWLAQCGPMIPALRSKAPLQLRGSFHQTPRMQPAAPRAVLADAACGPAPTFEDGLFSRIGDAHCHAQLDDNAQRLISELKVCVLRHVCTLERSGSASTENARFLHASIYVPCCDRPPQNIYITTTRTRRRRGTWQ